MEHTDSVSASEVKAQLESRRSDWQRISKESEVSYSWIAKFVKGRIKNPGAGTLLKLQQRLSVPASASGENAVS